MKITKLTSLKRIIILTCFLIGSVAGYSQTMGQMIERALEEIAALEAYIATAEKGYKIAEDGWHTIKNITDGEFNLHTVFYNSLKSVNPKVAQMGEVAEIISLQISIVEQAKKQMTFFRENKWMQSNELDYISNVYSTIVNTAAEDLQDLSSVITDDELQMGDGERIKRIHSIAVNMRAQSGLIQGFSDHANLLVLQRDRENRINKSIGNLYGIP